MRPQGLYVDRIVENSSSELDTAGAMTRLRRSCAGSAAPRWEASARFGYSANVTSPSITVTMPSFTATHHHLISPQGVPTALTTPTSQTRKVSGTNSTVPINPIAG
nr:hypothetical protein GCM10020063_091100 [Dactylosporangium thailandense]